MQDHPTTYGARVRDLQAGQAYGFLYCDGCGERCSADAGDYWYLAADHEFICECGFPMALVGLSIQQAAAAQEYVEAHGEPKVCDSSEYGWQVIRRSEYERMVKHNYAGPDSRHPGCVWVLSMDEQGATCLFTGAQVVEDES